MICCARDSALKVILQAGADPNSINHSGSLALHTACKNGHGGRNIDLLVDVFGDKLYEML